MGSKQWIGAIELGYILDTLLGVSNKVITVSSGSDMPSKAREIAHHFVTQVCIRSREGLWLECIVIGSTEASHSKQRQWP